MARLYFRYGTMGSSKSAQALMTKFNYEQKGMKVLLIKPSLDNRDDGEGTPMVRSRIGLSAECYTVTPTQSITELYHKVRDSIGCDVIIIDEAQFCTETQINECKLLTLEVPVMCYGLLVDFRSKLFEGTKRLVEISDSMQEIKSICKCGRKSTVNVRYVDGVAVDDGPVVLIGGDESYSNMCYWCWQKELAKGKNK